MQFETQKICMVSRSKVLLNVNFYHIFLCEGFPQEKWSFFVLGGEETSETQVGLMQLSIIIKFPVKFCFKTKKPGYIIAKSPTTIHILQSSDYCGCEGLYSGAAKQQTPVPNISPSYRNIPQLKKHTQNISEQTQALHTALSNPSIQQHSTEWNSWGIQLVVKPCTQGHPMIQNILSYSGDILQWGYPTAGMFYNWNDPTEGISYTGILPTAKILYNRETI